MVIPPPPADPATYDTLDPLLITFPGDNGTFVPDLEHRVQDWIVRILSQRQDYGKVNSRVANPHRIGHPARKIEFRGHFSGQYIDTDYGVNFELADKHQTGQCKPLFHGQATKIGPASDQYFLGTMINIPLQYHTQAGYPRKNYGQYLRSVLPSGLPSLPGTTVVLT